MKKTIAISIVLIISFCSLSVFASKNVIIGGGAILKKNNGEVITTGKALTFSKEIDQYVADIISSKFPLNGKQLNNYIQTNKPITLLYTNDAAKKLNEIYTKSLIAYPKIVEAHKVSSKKNGEKEVTQSYEYLESMKKIEHYEHQYNLLIEIAGKDIENALKIKKEYDELTNQLTLMDTTALKQINSIALKNAPSQEPLRKARNNKASALKYSYKKPNKKTGKCKINKKTLLIKKTASGNNCVYWQLPFKGKVEDEKINAIAKESFEPYYSIQTKLYGNYTDGKRRRNQGLKNELKIAEKKSKKAEGRYRKEANTYNASWKVIQNHDRIPRTKKYWKDYIARVQNKPFNIEESNEYSIKIKQPYIEALKKYYLAISQDILKRGIVEFSVLKDYKFEIEDGKYLATFVDLKSPVYQTNYGIITNVTTEHTLMAQKFQNNTLAFGYATSTPDRDYVFAVVLYLIGKHL